MVTLIQPCVLLPKHKGQMWKMARDFTGAGPLACAAVPLLDSLSQVGWHIS